VAGYVEKYYIYNLVPGTEGFSFQVADQIASDRDMYLAHQLSALKEFGFGTIPNSLIEECMQSIVIGIDLAITVKKHGWKPSWSDAGNSVLEKACKAVIKFADLLVTPSRKVIDLNKVPQMIRSKLYNSLHIFKNVRVLILGCGSGGWVTDVYSEKFAAGLPNMKHLVHISLKYDCNTNFLKSLSEACRNTIKILDVEFSKHVEDDSVTYIKRLKGLVKADLLWGLPNLRHLERGDFLADVIEDLEEKANMANNENMKNSKAIKRIPSLKVQEFWASEEYFFHTEEQMGLVSKYCPDIKQMLFMFQQTSCPKLSVLASFPNLEDLDLWGGSFYTDGLCDLLQEIGHRLKKLSLVHVEEVDSRAISIITVTCPNLIKLGLHNCDFDESDTTAEEMYQEGGFRISDRILRAEKWREVQKSITPMLDLETVRLVSEVSEHHLILLLSQCINVKEIFMGMSTSISDRVWSEVLAKNSLSKLESIEIHKCTKVTMHGIELLLANCDRLTRLTDMTYFEGVTPEEIEKLKARIKETNLNIVFDDVEEKNSRNIFIDENFMHDKMKEKYPPCAGWNDSELGAQRRLADDGGSAGSANNQEGLPQAPVHSTFRRF